ncbi:hypothetical protein [Chitinophaga ginsengisoli]|uniref:PXPV repeat-containing protein n=1 Tax=Chitinophaga ginsengisoli TaxID=363837 RepID=A0A2P8G4L2_9BACT|nr:hypothetical protein [Chitinophaga ginsengisoli]PSL28920.1 hypothetical protein CLV42_10766 [Chitinophaga ginsengisoli]
MKQIVLLLLLIGGGILSAQAQKRGHGHYRDYEDDNCRGRNYRVHHGRWEDCNRDYYRGAYYSCRPAPPPPQVVYVEPAPVVYVPAPPPPRPRVVYQRSPRVVIATGPIVVGL